MALFPNLGGSANACYFAGFWIIGALIGDAYSIIPLGHPFSLSLGYIVLSILTLTVFGVLVKPRVNAHTHRI